MNKPRGMKDKGHKPVKETNNNGWLNIGKNV
jgi:hypothetical protein